MIYSKCTVLSIFLHELIIRDVLNYYLAFKITYMDIPHLGIFMTWHICSFVLIIYVIQYESHVHLQTIRGKERFCYDKITMVIISS